MSSLPFLHLVYKNKVKKIIIFHVCRILPGAFGLLNLEHIQITSSIPSHHMLVLSSALRFMKMTFWVEWEESKGSTTDLNNFGKPQTIQLKLNCQKCISWDLWSCCKMWNKQWDSLVSHERSRKVSARQKHKAFLPHHKHRAILPSLILLLHIKVICLSMS